MRKILVLVMLTAGVIMLNPGCRQEHKGGNAVNTPTENASGNLAFERTSFDLGTIQQGETVGYNFQFTNEGSGAVMILDAKASCGCTVPSYSRKPIEPGGKGNVEVMFDSSGRIGRQEKNVTLRTNGDPAVIRLKIMADIVNPAT